MGAHQRHVFSALQINGVLSAVSSGSSLQRACEDFGADRQAFYRLLNVDNTLAMRYAWAVQQQTKNRFCTNGD